MTEFSIDSRAVSRWLNPRTLVHTIVLCIVVYLLLQPLLVGVVLPLFEPPVFTTWAQWLRFLILLVPLGVVAGTLWWLSERLRQRWLRYWVRATVRAFTLVIFLSANMLSKQSQLGWMGRVILVSALLGVMFSWMERWYGDLNRVDERSQ